MVSTYREIIWIMVGSNCMIFKSADTNPVWVIAYLFCPLTVVNDMSVSIGQIASRISQPYHNVFNITYWDVFKWSFDISMAQSKTAVYPVHKQLRYCSLSPSHRYSLINMTVLIPLRHESFIIHLLRYQACHSPRIRKRSIYWCVLK